MPCDYLNSAWYTHARIVFLKMFLNIMYNPTPEHWNSPLNLWGEAEMSQYMTLAKFHLKLQALLCIFAESNLILLYWQPNKAGSDCVVVHSIGLTWAVILFLTLVLHCEVKLKFNLLKLATVRAPEQHPDIMKNGDLEGNCDSCPH